jgi:hypothetical protein
VVIDARAVLSPSRLMKLKHHLSLIILIVVNLLPIFGVVYGGWDVFEIVVLYWFENVVIGVVNLFKILSSAPVPDDADANGKPLPEYLRSDASAVFQHAAKFFLIPFFTIHYGMFCFVHGIFVFALLGEKSDALGAGSPISGMREMTGSLFQSDIKWCVIAIIASHVFSFFHNYLGKGEFRKNTPSDLMHAPYGRIVVLHIAIILGAFAITAIGSSAGMLILLIIGKIIVDAKLHLRSHQKIDGEKTA